MIIIKRRARTVQYIDGHPTVIVAGKRRRESCLLGDGDANTKTRKNGGRGYRTAGLSLAPVWESGVGSTCPHATDGCSASCLNETGLAAIWPDIRAARIAKTVVYFRQREWFLDTLQHELTRWQRSAKRGNTTLAVRLNMFSDIAWERHGIIDQFPQTRFYDYTKNPRRAGLIRPNYWVTFSRSENNDRDCLSVLESGGNVAVVFADVSRSFVGNRAGGQQLPAEWNGYPVVDGDVTDLRFEDPRGGYVIGLRLKAPTNEKRRSAIESGFAVVSKGKQNGRTTSAD